MNFVIGVPRDFVIGRYEEIKDEHDDNMPMTTTTTTTTMRMTAKKMMMMMMMMVVVVVMVVAMGTKNIEEAQDFCHLLRRNDTA